VPPDTRMLPLPFFPVTAINSAVLKRLLEKASDKPTRSLCMTACIYSNYFALFTATIFFILLLVGTSLQTDGWIRYSPNGTFLTLQLPPFEQRILFQCSPPTANANTSYPTVPPSLHCVLFFFMLLSNAARVRYGLKLEAVATEWQTYGPSVMRSRFKASECAPTTCPA
jgi:hypothetical protein